MKLYAIYNGQIYTYADTNANIQIRAETKAQTIEREGRGPYCLKRKTGAYAKKTNKML